MLFLQFLIDFYFGLFYYNSLRKQVCEGISLASLSIYAGGYGSGKTEVALNFALEKAAGAGEVVLADLDFVNPYFVSREVKADIEQKGIKLIAPSGEFFLGDVPNVPAEIIGFLRQDNDMLLDLAGDEIGALMLGYLSRYVALRPNYNLYLVLNPYRPFAMDLHSIKELKVLLEDTANLKFTGIISNPNLVEETDIDVIRKGHQKVLSFAKSFGIPVKYLTVEERFYDQLFPEYRAMLKKLKLYLRPDWLQ